jgi:hypothetical protein
MKKLVLMIITLMVMYPLVSVNAQVFIQKDKAENNEMPLFKSPKKEFKKAYEQGRLSSFGFNYLSTFYKSQMPSDDSLFWNEFQQFEDGISREGSFTPEIEKQFIKDSLIIEKDSLYSLLKMARKKGKITISEYLDMKRFYKDYSYDPINMKFFMKRYKEIKCLVN